MQFHFDTHWEAVVALGSGGSAEGPPRPFLRVETPTQAAARAALSACNPLSSVFPSLAVTGGATGRGEAAAQVEVGLVLLLQKSGAGIHGGPHAQVMGHGHHFGQVLATYAQGGGIGELQQGEEALFAET